MDRLAALLLLTLLPGCALLGGSARPAWIDAPYAHPDCDQTRQLCATGVAKGHDAEARQLSRQRALQEILATIQAEVQSVIQIDTVSRRENDQVFWSEEIAEHIRLSAAEDLPGAEVVARWTDPESGDIHTLVAVRRDRLLDKELPSVDQAIARAQQLLQAAQAAEGGDPARALTLLLQAHQALAEAYGTATKAQVIASHSPWSGRAGQAFASTSGLLAHTSDELARLGARVRIEKLAGDGQAGRVHASLATELVARFLYLTPGDTEVPLADLPVSFVPATPGAAALEPSGSTTDARGEIRCAVHDLGPTGQADNAIIVRPAIEQLAPSLGPERLPSARFAYHLPTPGQTTLLLALTDRFDGQPLDPPFLLPLVAGHLSSRGFDVRSEAPAGLSPASASAAELISALGGQVDYVLRGSADVWPRGTQRGIVWFGARARIELIDLRGGEGRELTTPEIKDGALETGPAGARKVIRSLEPAVLELLDTDFVDEFAPTPPPDDGQDAPPSG